MRRRGAANGAYPLPPPHHCAVLLDPRHVLLVALALLLLLNAADNAPRRAARANDVLVCNAQQVALLHRQLLVVDHLRHLLHLLHHLVIALGLCMMREGDAAACAGWAARKQRTRHAARQTVARVCAWPRPNA